jgi:hypothetical protein
LASVIEPKDAATMAKKKKRQNHDAAWAEAKRLCRLSADDVRKAKELGLKPRTLIRNRPNAQQQWKLPVHLWVRELYDRKHGGMTQPRPTDSGQHRPTRGVRPSEPIEEFEVYESYAELGIATEMDRLARMTPEQIRAEQKACRLAAKRQQQIRAAESDIERPCADDDEIPF